MVCEGFQIAVVDADQLRFQAKRPFQLILIMDFYENVHAVREGRLFELGGAAVVDGGHDDEDAIGADARALPSPDRCRT